MGDLNDGSDQHSAEFLCATSKPGDAGLCMADSHLHQHLWMALQQLFQYWRYGE